MARGGKGAWSWSPQRRGPLDDVVHLITLLEQSPEYVCGLPGFPPHRDDASARAYGFALAVSVLCVLLALLLTFRPAAVRVLVVAVLVPAAPAAAQLFEGRFHSAVLSRAGPARRYGSRVRVPGGPDGAARPPGRATAGRGQPHG